MVYVECLVQSTQVLIASIFSSQLLRKRIDPPHTLICSRNLAKDKPLQIMNIGIDRPIVKLLFDEIKMGSCPNRLQEESNFDYSISSTCTQLKYFSSSSFIFFEWNFVFVALYHIVSSTLPFWLTIVRIVSIFARFLNDCRSFMLVPFPWGQSIYLVLAMDQAMRTVGETGQFICVSFVSFVGVSTYCAPEAKSSTNRT